MAVFKARYKGTCKKCARGVTPGEYVSWSRRERGVIYHAQCIGESVPGDGGQPEPMPGQPDQPTPPPTPETLPGVTEDRIRTIAQEEDVSNLRTMLDAVEERLTKHVPQTLKITVRKADGSKDRVTIDNAHAMLKSLVYLVSKGEHVYLYGPPGSGKSTGAVQAAKALGRHYGYVSLNPQTPESRLLGFIDAGGVYRETEFFRCFKWCGIPECDCCTGGVFCIDELDNGHPALLNTLNGMFESDSDGIGRGAFPCGVVLRHPAFVCVATGNTSGRGADKLFPERRALDAAFLERFVFLAWGYDEALEKAITLAINKEATKWLAWIRKVRHYVTEHGIRLWASPRASFKGATLLRDSGWTVPDIAQAVMFKGLDPDTVSHIIAACPYPEHVARTTIPVKALTE